MSEMTIIPDLYLEGNSKRILYSNDGLIFISYDHAKTFYELVE